jgi:SAM-dependent methyltransferase
VNQERKAPLGNVCPSCLSFERHRLLWLFLRDRTDLFSSTAPRTLLHVAPEPCLQKRLSKLPHFDYIVSDLQSKDAHERMDITNIGSADCSFDIILCNHVLEHVPDDKKAMRELLRVLKPDGWAIINVPVEYNREKTYEDPSIVSEKERKLHFGLEDHVRVYGKDYRERLGNAGFSVQEIDFASELGKAASERYVLLSDEMIYFCKKAD